jgi:hypothetical protein
MALAASEQDAELAAFLAAAKAKGASDEFLVRLLEQRGWPEKKIYRELGGYYERMTGVAIPARAGGAGENAKDAFLYLLSFSALGIWSIGLGSLLFTLFDIWLPGIPAQRITVSPSYAISESVASIMVGFPVYLLVMRFILRGLDANREKYESGVRRWLTYIALLAASSIVIGDLITFLAFFLRGDLTLGFVLKVLAVLVIAGGTFWYYLATLKPTASRPRALMRPKEASFATAAVALVLAALAFGFWTLGSPVRQQEAAWDTTRVANLRSVAQEIRAQWKRKDDAPSQQLPVNLDALARAPGAQPLSLEDPVTGQRYQYRAREGSAYELCATFARASEEYGKRTPGKAPSFWNHGSGRHCFVLDAARDVPQ